MDKAKELIRLATEQFGKLTDADRRFFEVVANGETADYRAGNADIDEPANADKWGGKRSLEADRIVWLCVDKEASQYVTHVGIFIIGAAIKGTVNLGFVGCNFPLVFFKCNFNEGLDIKYGNLKVLSLEGTRIRFLKGNGVRVEGDIYLKKGFKASGEVCLIGANIGGDLICNRGKFINEKDGTSNHEDKQGDKSALSADKIKVGGSVYLHKGFEARGEVRLLGAKIGGNIECDNGKFINKGGRAISADGARV